MQIAKIGAALLLFALAAWSGYVLLKEPQGDLAWLPEQSQLTTIETQGGHLVFHNVRDWTYSDTEVLSQEWIDMAVSPEDITRAWLFIDYFSSIHGIAHPFLSFEFADGRTLVVSVEARRETDEAYSPLKGAIRSYELMYVWSTERDMIARRLVNANHSVSLFPLELSPEESADLFTLLAEDTNLLAEKPRFYNTITGNCMSLLARLINTLQPGRLPYHFSWNLPGYADNYLIEEGLIDPNTKDISDLTPHREAVRSFATTTAEAFSSALRMLQAD